MLPELTKTYVAQHPRHAIMCPLTPLSGHTITDFLRLIC